MSVPATTAITTYFEGASGVHIREFNVLDSSGASPQGRLYSKVVTEAIHDSNERCDAPKCHPETRTAVQEDVIGWIRDGDEDSEPMKIMWITGPAGSGKTAIVGSVAETCDECGLLAATFFFSSFSGSEGRRLKGGLVTTLVYQLTQLDGMEGFEADVLSTIRRNPAIFDARLQKQVEILILKPLRYRRASGAPPISAQVVIIDGLDEVEAPASHQLVKEDARLRNEADQVEILCALRHAANDPAFPFRILIASRPERVIHDFLSGGAGGASCRKVSLHEQYDAEADIRLFLNAKLTEIRRRYRLASSWPAEETLTKLVETASGQFIYAATVTRFLEDGKAPNPQASLLKVLDWRSQDEGVHGLEPLDALYTRILSWSRDPLLATQWLRIIDQYIISEPALFVKQLLQDYEGQAEELLEDLASLIDIPSSDREGQLPYKFYHKSLQDFLRSSCSERLCPNDNDLLLSQRCVEIFRNPSLAVSHSDAKCRTFVKTLFESCLFAGNALFDLFSTNRDRCALPLCDAEWWVRWTFVDARFVGNYCHQCLFVVAHLKCGKGGFRACTEVCKHWRSTFLRICHEQKLPVPDVFDLLLTNLAEDLVRDYDVFDSFHDEVKTLPPPPLSTFRNPVDLQTLDANYEKMCATADYMHSCLPDGWMEKFNHKFRNDMDESFWDARWAIDDRIEQMGLQLEVTEYRYGELSTDDADLYDTDISEDDTDDEVNDSEDESGGEMDASDDDGTGNFEGETSENEDVSAKEDVDSRGDGGAAGDDWWDTGNEDGSENQACGSRAEMSVLRPPPMTYNSNAMGLGQAVPIQGNYQHHRSGVYPEFKAPREVERLCFAQNGWVPTMSTSIGTWVPSPPPIPSSGAVPHNPYDGTTTVWSSALNTVDFTPASWVESGSYQTYGDSESFAESFQTTWIPQSPFTTSIPPLELSPLASDSATSSSVPLNPPTPTPDAGVPIHVDLDDHWRQWLYLD